MAVSNPVYHCILDAPVWTADSNPRHASPPSLGFWQANSGSMTLLASVCIRVDDLRTRDRWIVQVFPLSGTDLPWQREDGDYGLFRRRMPQRVEPHLEQGELRVPRDSATEAIKVALQLLAEDDVPQSDLTAIAKVAEVLRPPLERLTTNYVTRFRPR